MRAANEENESQGHLLVKSAHGIKCSCIVDRLCNSSFGGAHHDAESEFPFRSQFSAIFAVNASIFLVFCVAFDVKFTSVARFTAAQ